MKYFYPVLAVIVIALIIAGVFTLQAKSPITNKEGKLMTSQSTPLPGNLQSTDLMVGSGAEATAGHMVKVNYLGTLTDGTKFDSSYDRNQPFEFTLGSGQVIKGWDQGVAGMKVGGKRKLVIPPDLGYGAQANGKIPANSTLVFEIELLGVQ